MNCSNCGAKIEDTRSYCYGCGQLLQAGHAPFQTAPQPASTSSGQSSRLLVIIIGSLIGCGLLVVLGIVSAIAIPVLVTARDAAKKEAARNAVRSVVSAEYMYFEEHKCYADLETLTTTHPPLLSYTFAEDEITRGVKVVEAPEDGQQTFRIAIQAGNYVISADESGELTESP